jgi:beta-lactam-binding protein with PASTA domain
VDGKVLVPALVGLTMSDATRLAATAGVVVEQVTTGLVTPDAVVDAQQPLAGLQVEPGSAVQVTVTDTGRGGGGGSALDPPPPVLDGPSGAGTATVV